MSTLLGLVALFGLSSLVQENDKYIITTEIFKDELLVGNPIIVIAPGEEACAKVENVYAFAVAVDNIQEPLLLLKTRLQINEQSLSPDLSIKFGEQSTFIINGIKLKIWVRKSHY